MSVEAVCVAIRNISLSARSRAVGPALSRVLGGVLVCSTLASAADAQLPGTAAAQSDRGTTVSWAADPAVASPGARRAVISLRGNIRNGWHIYALNQSATGPTPLLIAIEPNDTAIHDGQPVGSAPTIAFEPALGFVTPYYTRDVTITIPVRLRRRLALGRRVVPVSVRYQSCDGRTCEPPRTVRVAAPIDVRAIS